ncbi:hypothetical protein [Jiangella asiatica]|uniref:Uncharacterized protein n=1 Tax=Jiangella asiatica TaxID=2530372 RepID=A0A4R5DDI5_9ACTN|nr:hypothetical protein [Jiangella asiatica]TDE11892.1 hypothetical protein E1269_09050 [Jiangella asiatica]
MTIVAFLIAFVVLLVAAVAVWYARRTVDGESATTRVRRRMRVRGRAHFQLEHTSRHRYVLHNDGSASAYDVRLLHGDVVVEQGATHFREFPPGRSEEYLLFQPMQGPQDDIRIAWRTRRGAPETVVRLPLNTGIVPSEGQEA